MVDTLTQRQGALRAADGSVGWCVWAPRQKHLHLVTWRGGRRCEHAMSPVGNGYFEFGAADVEEGCRYAYRLGDDSRELPDPASRWQPDGVHHPSAVWFPESFEWSDGDWRGVPREELVIYELHIGTFTREGSFDAAISRLADLRDLGVTAIEIMPVAQFPGRRNWGYDNVYWYAVQNTYGGPRALQRLVDASHRLGLAVILDVVYNHLGPEGNYASQYGPYDSEHHRTPWGPGMNFDGRARHAVRAFVLDNVRYWIRDFHVDGLRLDSVHAVVDHSPRHILEEIGAVAHDVGDRAGRTVHVIAESNLNDVRVLDAPQNGGYGLDAQWSDDFHHCVHALVTGERNGYYADFTDPPRQLLKALTRTFVFDGCYSAFRGRPHGKPANNHGGERFIVSIQTHDQVGNRLLGERLHENIEPRQLRLAAGLLLLAPYVPLLFMGEEYAEASRFPFFCDFGDPRLQEAVRRGRSEEFRSFDWKGDFPDPSAQQTFESAVLSWRWPEQGARAGLRRLYQDLLAARRAWPALRDFRHRDAELLDVQGGRPVLRLVRGDPMRATERIEAFFNLGEDAVPLPPSGIRASNVLLHSDDVKYGGEQRGTVDGLAGFAFVIRGHMP